MPTATPHAARAIFAGLGDRLATTDQARMLWEHWDQPETSWFAGNHVGYLWSDTVWRFVDSVLDRRGLSLPGNLRVGPPGGSAGEAPGAREEPSIHRRSRRNPPSADDREPAFGSQPV
jgi:hypothetical protein